jgi:hypothetical protein
MLDNSGSLYAALVVKGLKEFRVDTNRMSFIGRGRDISHPWVLTKEYRYTGEEIGDTLYPCFGIYSDIPVAANSNLEFYAAMIISDNYDKLIEEINEADSVDFLKHAEIAGKVISVNFFNKCVKGRCNDIRTLADCLINVKHSNEQLLKLSDPNTRAVLESSGIYPYNKYIVLEYRGDGSDSLLKQYLGMMRYLLKADVKVRLVIIYTDGDLYHQSAEKHIEELASRESGVNPVYINESENGRRQNFPYQRTCIYYCRKNTLRKF